ncbi:MAG: histidine ammonia-lyase [Bacteroidales bacterium]|nr:histidine ammonia-lyase [Bacteroidales bacterium]
MDSYHIIDDQKLTFKGIFEILKKNLKLKLSEKAAARIQNCRTYLDKKIETNKEPIYGINTGFGALYNRSISQGDLGKLQENLVMSHASGTGEEVPVPVVRLMLLLKIQAFAQGYSGVQLLTVQRLIDFYNHEITPVVYQLGSLGASGDLAPLAHMSLPLLGKGKVYFEGKKVDAEVALKKLGCEPIQLQSKEGLALLNGTQFMSAYGVYSVLKVFRLSDMADIIGAVSLDAFDGRIEPFYEGLHTIRPHLGQLQTAERFRSMLEGSQLISQPKKHVQDPYSFRCIPQVHGASKDVFNHVASVLSREINAVTDNPTVFPEEDLILSGGNFHGQPLALAMDYLALGVAELGNISERRTYQLISGSRDLPSFLVADPGLNSGFMIPQYTAASIVNQNKQLCTPASVDSIVSSQGQEDHVSMGANAATKLYKVVMNLERILAIELFNAAQALDFRKPVQTSPYLADFVKKYRTVVSFVEEDKIMHDEIEQSIKFLQEVEYELPDALVPGI